MNALALHAEVATGYAEQAAQRARDLADPIEAALLAAVADGATASEAARALGISERTARNITRRLMGLSHY